MKTMTTVKRTLAGCGGLALTLALVAGPVAGQERMREQAPDTSRNMMRHGMTQGGMSGMMQMMQSMHAQDGMMGSPMMILRLEESLELTESQVDRLKAIQESAQAGMRQHMMQGMQAMRGSQTLLDGDAPDLDAYEAKLNEAASHMVRAHASMATAAVEAREVLTAGQREKLSLARAVMKEMGSGMMQGGMMNQNEVDGGTHRHEG